MDQLGDMNLDVDVSAGAEAEIDEDGVSAEAEADAGVKLETYNPALDIAYQYKDAPLVAGNLAVLKSTFGDLTKQIKDWNDATPDNFELKAESIIWQRMIHFFTDIMM